MQNTNAIPQIGIPNRDELLHRVQQYETDFVHSMTENTLQQTGFLSEHELVADVMNSVALQSTPTIWNHYGSLVDGFECIDQTQEADYDKDNID